MMKLFASSLLVSTGMAVCDYTKINEAMIAFTTCSAGAANDKSLCKCLDTYISAFKSTGCTDDSSWKAAFEAQEDAYKKSCGTKCFPATATVELISGKTKSMDQVVAGDQVRVGPKEFSEVYFFSTQLHETTSKFVKIETEHGPSLSLTGGHYLYVNGNELRQAWDVKAGDVVVLANGTKSPVTGISSDWAPGLYNPHTLHGDVVVDGIVTSSYTDAVHPTLAHALLMPLRQLYAAGVTFGGAFNAASKALPSYILKAINAEA